MEEIMNLQSKRILTLIILILPVLIAGLLTKNLTLDIVPILAIAAFSFWAAVQTKHNGREKL